MIRLTRFNGIQFYLNITHIETVEATPDTVITLTNGKKFIVKEDAQEVAARINSFYQSVPLATVVPRPLDEINE